LRFGGADRNLRLAPGPRQQPMCTMNVEVSDLGEDDVPKLVDVLCEAFAEYPVMHFVLGSSEDYPYRLRTLVQFFVMARVLSEERLLGVRDGTDFGAVALVSRPDDPASHPALGRLREETWAQLGVEAHQRYEAFGRAWSTLNVDRPQLHLNMIGVRRRVRGRGLGRLLMDHVHDLSVQDPVSTGVSLTTEDEANVGLYQHMGYAVVGHALVAPGISTWGFFRAD
jgi:ribosomal protein S18 acetylase RimI-like enzyme